MLTYERRDKVRESFSNIFWASVTGSLLGLSLGVIGKAFGSKEPVRSKAANMMFIGGTYAAAECFIERTRGRARYTPIIAACAAGVLSSNGSAKSMITTSMVAITFGSIFDNREEITETAKYLLKKKDV